MSKEDIKELHFSDQALGAVMMAMQRSLVEQWDIVPILKGFKLADNHGDLIVLNPPVVKVNHDDAAVLSQAVATEE